MPTTTRKPETPKAKRAKAKAAKARYWWKRGKGLCVQTHCPKKAAPGRTRCAACETWLRERAREAQRRARAGVTHKERRY